MNNPMLNSMVNVYQQYRNNPMEAVRSMYDVPDDIDESNPDAIIQHLYNTQQISQQQLNRINSLRNNPLISKLLGLKF